MINFNKLDENLTVRDAKITHLSTWFIAKDPAIIQTLSTITGEDIVPITIKVS